MLVKSMNLLSTERTGSNAAPILRNLFRLNSSANSDVRAPLRRRNRRRPRAVELDPLVLECVTSTTAEIRRLRDLPEDWDGHGAPRIDGSTINFAMSLFATLASRTMPKPSVVPTVGGGVQMEWHTLTHHVELEVERPNRFSLFVVRRDLQQEPTYIDSGMPDQVQAELAAALG